VPNSRSAARTGSLGLFVIALRVSTRLTRHVLPLKSYSLGTVGVDVPCRLVRQERKVVQLERWYPQDATAEQGPFHRTGTWSRPHRSRAWLSWFRKNTAARWRPRPPADVLCDRSPRPLLCRRVVRLAANLLHQRHKVAGVATTHRHAGTHKARAADHVTYHCRFAWRPFTARSHCGTPLARRQRS
jgi:hypothetical protein